MKGFDQKWVSLGALDRIKGEMIPEEKKDILFFFTNPLSSAPHDVAIKVLFRFSTLRQAVIACNRVAGYEIPSKLFLQIKSSA